MSNAPARHGDGARVEKARVRPTAIVRTAIREAAASGLEMEIRSDGTIILRQPSTETVKAPLAKGRGVVL